MQVLSANPHSLAASFARLRWLGVAVALLFFILQSAAFTHDAKHGFGKHEHAGKICAVYQYCDHLTFDHAPPPPVFHLPMPLATFQPVAMLLALTETSIPAAAQPRAPPAQA